jgi:hypothetical protein
MARRWRREEKKRELHRLEGNDMELCGRVISSADLRSILASVVCRFVVCVDRGLPFHWGSLTCNRVIIIIIIQVRVYLGA